MSDITTEANTRASADTNLQNQVNSLNQSVSNGKNQVANAITGKGVAASGSDSFATLASKISQIKSVPATAAYDTGQISYSGTTSTSFPTQDDWFTFSYYSDGKYSGTNATKKGPKTFSLGNYTALYVYFQGFSVQAYYGNGWRLSAYALAFAYNGGFVVIHYYDNNNKWRTTQAARLSLYSNIDNRGSFNISANSMTIDIPMFSYDPNSRFEYRLAYWTI